MVLDYRCAEFICILPDCNAQCNASFAVPPPRCISLSTNCSFPQTNAIEPPLDAWHAGTTSHQYSISCKIEDRRHVVHLRYALQDVTDLPDSTEAFAPAPAPQKRYESTNMWEYKPQWCQPWSILLTGSLIISAVNFVSHSSYLFTGLVAVPVLIWWYLFLILVPQSFRSYVQEQKSKGR